MGLGMPADRARSAGADAVALGASAGRLDERRMMREAQIIVAAESKVAAPLDDEVRPVSAFHHAPAAAEPGARELVELQGEIGHGGSLG